MARGISPATIVPTASDDCGESAASISDDEDGGGYSSEESVAKAAVASAVQLGSAKYLQAAFNSQAASSQSESSEHHEAAVDDQEAEGSAPPKAHGSEAQQKAIPPLIGKSLRQRSQSAVIQKHNGVELTKNYLELVKDFRQLRPYTRRPDGTYPSDTLCVYCVYERPTAVFFPCQHMCVCNDCIAANNITTDYSSPSDWSACPICMTDIRLILPHSGKEEDKYWKWVLEIKPSLPSNFKQEFKEAGRRLNKDVGSAAPRGRRSSIVTLFRREGTFKGEKDSVPAANAQPEPKPKATDPGSVVNAQPEPKPKAKVPPLGRRHSWQPGAESAVQNVAASNEHDEAHNCSIL